MTEVYICPDHRAEWDTMRQGYYCLKCDQQFTEHDIPGLQRRIDSLQAELKEAQLRVIWFKDCAKHSDKIRELEEQARLLRILCSYAHDHLYDFNFDIKESEPIRSLLASLNPTPSYEEQRGHETGCPAINEGGLCGCSAPKPK